MLHVARLTPRERGEVPGRLENSRGSASRMSQFLHLHHQGRGHSPCHHQLQRSSEWTRQRTDIIVMIYAIYIQIHIVLDI